MDDMTRLVLVALALSACGPAPVTLDDAPPPPPAIELVPTDPVISDALAWGLSWWRDAGETRPAAIVSECTDPTAMCVVAVWESDGVPTHLGEYLPAGPRIRFAPKVQGHPTYVHAVAAHELGHAFGYAHVAADEVENLMSPKPAIASGTLCIDQAGATVCRDLGSGP